MREAVSSIARNMHEARKRPIVAAETIREKAACIGMALSRSDRQRGREDAIMHARQLAALYGQAVETDNPFNLVSLPSLRSIGKEITAHCAYDGHARDMLDAVDRWAGRQMTSRFPVLNEVSRPGVGLDVGLEACRSLLEARERLLEKANGHAAATIAPRRSPSGITGRIAMAIHGQRRKHFERQADAFRTKELPRGIAAEALCRAISTHLYFLDQSEPLGMEPHIGRDRLALDRARQDCERSDTGRKRFARAWGLLEQAQRRVDAEAAPSPSPH